MHEIGAMLREEREAKGISLEEIQRRSRISIRYLEALEEGKFDVIPGEVYVRGFLKRYAESLEIDPNLVMERYLRTIKEAQEAEAQRETAPVNRSAERRRFNAWPAILTVLALAVIGFFVSRPLLAPKRVDNGISAPPGATAQPDSQPAALPSIEDAAESGDATQDLAASEDREGGAIPLAPSPSAGASGRQAEASRTRPIEIQVRLSEGCWLEVIADGTVQLRAVRPAGETLNFAGDESVRIRFGNPRGAQVYWNGQEVPLPEIDATTRLFTAAAVTVVKPAPKPAAPSKPVTSKTSQAGPPITTTPAPGRDTTSTPAQTLPNGTENGTSATQPTAPGN